MKNTIWCVAIVMLLFSSGVQAQKRPIDKSLIKAIQASDYKQVKKLIDIGANVNAQDENQATALMWAIYKSDLKMVKLLVKYGADVKKKGFIYLDEEKESYYGAPLSIAAGTGKLDIVQYLVEKLGVLPKDKQLVKDKGETGWTALHEACASGHTEIVKYLLEKGADINSQVKENFKPLTPTPLICAIRTKDLELIKYLLDQKADPDLADEYDITPLGYAVINNNLSLIRLLLSYKANINYPQINGAGILMLAAYMNFTDIFRFLVWNGAEVKSGNALYLGDQKIYVYSLPAMAAARGNIELLKYLRDSFHYDLTTDLFTLNDSVIHVLSPLHAAVLSDQTETAEFLIEQGSPVDQLEYVNKLTALIYAVFRNNFELTRFLVEKGADINFNNSKSGYTPLIIATRDGYTDIAKYLLEKGADPTFTDIDGYGPYYYALKSDDDKLADLFDWKKLFNEKKVRYPSSLLYQALLTQKPDTAELMLKYGFDPNQPDKYGNNGLVYAVRSGNLQEVKLLLNNKAIINYSTSENPLCKAIETNTEIARLLIDKGVDINAKTIDGDYPVFRAIDYQNYEILNLLIKHGVDLTKLNKEGLTVLQAAILKNDLLTVKALLAAGAQVNQTNSKGENAYQFAEAQKADKKMMELLFVEELSLIELIDNQLEWSIIPLIKKHPELANEKDSNGFPLLHRLVKVNAKDIIQKIAGYGINLNITDSMGRTALYYAILLGNKEMAYYLGGLNIDINKPCSKGENALELAISHGYTDLAQFLTTKGAKVRKNVSVRPDLFVPVGHTAGVAAFDISADGKYLISHGRDKTVRLWEISSGKEIKVFNEIYPNFAFEKTNFHKNVIRFSPDGNRFLVFNKKKIEEYDVQSGEKLREFNEAGYAAYSPDGKYILTTGYNEDKNKQKAILFDAQSGEILYKSENFSEGVAAFSPSGKYFIYQDQGKTILCNTSDFSIIKVFETGTLRSFSFSPDEKKLVYSDDGRNIELIDLDSGRHLIETIKHPGAVVCFSPDGKIIASGGHDQLVILWNAETGEKIRELFGHDHYISGLKFSPDGKYLFSSSRDQTIIQWDVTTGKKFRVFGSNSWRPTHVAFSPDSKYLVCTGNDYSVNIWDLHKSTSVNHLVGHKGVLFGFAFSPDSTNVLTFGEDRVPRMWNFSTGKRTATFRTHDDAVLGAGFSPDGKYCFSYSNDNKVILWEVNTGKMILKLTQKYLVNQAHMIIPNQYPSGMFGFTPDSKYFITGDTVVTIAPTLLFWEVSTGRLIKKITLTPDKDKNVKSPAIRFINNTPDGKSIVCGFSYTAGKTDYSEIHFFDAVTFEFQKRLEFEGSHQRASFTPDGKKIIVFEETNNKIIVLDAANGNILYKINKYEIDDRNSPVSPDGKYLLAFHEKIIMLVNLNNLTDVKVFTPCDKIISSAGFSPDGKYLVYSATDNTIGIIETENFKTIAKLVLFGENDWVVSNEDGLFDASSQAMKLLYYISGLEVIELDQMKERYYEPNLLPKLLGFNKEKIRDVKALEEVNLYPEVDVNISNSNLMIDLTNRGGGIGKVVVLVNGKEVASDARGPKPDPKADKLKINLDLKNHPYLQSGKENIIEVKAYNAEGYLVSRGSSISYNPGAGKISKPPHLYVIACGVSDYTGEQIDLKYAAKDAEDVGNALKIGGERLFGTDKTHLYLMTTNAGDEKMQPTKANILRVFDEISKNATSDDVFVLYLSGHGINWGGQDGDFYYLTKDAYTASPEAYGDPKIRTATTISSAELTDLFKKIPALKQVMMIDACASGKAVENLMAKRDISASTLRALDRMKDRVGMYIITGCAADAVSYEASKFGQGLLTYSLLEGIKGLSLREDRFIDIAMLFTRAQERVPELAADIGGIQKPQIFSPYGSQSFDIGELTEQDKEKISLAQPKPMFLMSVFLEEESMDDILGLEKLVDDEFRLISSKGISPVIFVQAKEFPEAYRMRGQYAVNGDQVEIKINLFKGKEKAGSFTVSGKKDNPENIVKTIVEKALEIAK